ncbi:MAG: hypothetical protein FOGNACKC_02878 [Anaerolineae bacterium]|nr:hypothetical protein [Anaerolineae bacterium]
MKTIKYVITIMGLFLTTLFPLPRAQAQGGCPAQLPGVQQYTVVDAVEWVSATPERPSTTTPYVFVDLEVSLNVEVGQRVFLSSSPDTLAPTCVDDYLEISGPLGTKTFDYRSADRSRIEARDGLDAEITDLLEPGDNRVRVRLIDVGQYYSNSAIYAVVVIGLLPTRTGHMPTPTVTLAPPVTTPAIKTATATVRPTATTTKTVMLVIPTEPDEPLTEAIPILPWPRLLLALALLGVGLGVLGLLRYHLSPTGHLPGELEIYKGGRYVKTLVLAEFNKVAITLGSGAMDIWLPGDNVPSQAAKLFTKVVEGQYQPFLLTFDPDGAVHEERQLHHDDNLYLGDYRLVYKNLTEEAPFYLIGELHNA